jgi:hypothetical protein
MALLLEEIKAAPDGQLINICYHPTNERASAFYRNFGFAERASTATTRWWPRSGCADQSFTNIKAAQRLRRCLSIPVKSCPVLSEPIAETACPVNAIQPIVIPFYWSLGFPGPSQVRAEICVELSGFRHLRLVRCA